MDIKTDAGQLNNNAAIQIDGVLPRRFCENLIARYQSGAHPSPLGDIAEEIINACSERVFSNELNAQIAPYFESAFQVMWPTFDVVDCAGSSDGFSDYPSTRWHLDGGITGTLKLFVYLNPVAEHGGNTLIIDPQRTKVLRREGALPLEHDKRLEDLTPVLAQAGLDPSVLAYDLDAGDGLLFNPLTQAHRCQPPKPGKKRYTVCFTLVPVPCQSGLAETRS